MRMMPVYTYVCVTLAAIIAGCGPQTQMAKKENDGEKLAAFRVVVEKYHDAPDEFASSEQRSEYNRELSKLQDAFDSIEFDPTEDRQQAQAIVELFQQGLEKRYGGGLYNELEESVREIYSRLTR